MSTSLRGTPAAPGRARGPLFLAAEPVSGERVSLSGGRGVEALREAAERVAARLEEIARRRRNVSPAAADVLEAQAMMARDPALEESAAELLAGGAPLETAVAQAAEGHARQLEELDDDYMRERAADVREVGRLLTAELSGRPASRLDGLSAASVVVAGELAPADLLGVDPAHLLGLVTEAGGVTSHTAIVARELSIPAVVGVAGLMAAATGARARSK